MTELALTLCQTANIHAGHYCIIDGFMCVYPHLLLVGVTLQYLLTVTVYSSCGTKASASATAATATAHTAWFIRCIQYVTHSV